MFLDSSAQKWLRPWNLILTTKQLAMTVYFLCEIKKGHACLLIRLAIMLDSNLLGFFHQDNILEDSISAVLLWRASFPDLCDFWLVQPVNVSPAVSLWYQEWIQDLAGSLSPLPPFSLSLCVHVLGGEIFLLILCWFLNFLNLRIISLNCDCI